MNLKILEIGLAKNVMAEDIMLGLVIGEMQEPGKGGIKVIAKLLPFLDISSLLMHALFCFNAVKQGKGKAKANSSEAGNGEVTGPTQGRQSLVRTELPLTLNAPVKKRGRGRPPKVAPTSSEPVIQVVPRANKKRIANTQHSESVTKPKRNKKNGIQTQP